MGDLISRKTVHDMLHGLGGCDATDMWSKGWDRAIDNAINMLVNIPIAYDVGEVVKQIKKRKVDNIRVSKLQGNSHVKKIAHICRADEDDCIIKIVKGAVKDE